MAILPSGISTIDIIPARAEYAAARPKYSRWTRKGRGHAALGGLRDGHGHPAVLERAGGVEPLILEEHTQIRRQPLR